MKISDILKPEHIVLDLADADKEKILACMIDCLTNSGAMDHPEEILASLLDRESIQSTGVGDGIAIPHAKSKKLKSPILCLALSKEGVEYESLDQQPVHLLFMIIVPEATNVVYLQLLSKAARLLRDKNLREQIFATKSAAEIIKLIKDKEEA